MDFRILGPIEVVDGDRVVPLPRLKNRALLALLLLHAGEVVSVDRLLEDLWGGRPPQAARNALQNYVSQLRKALGAKLVLTRAPGYVLDVGTEQVDFGRFDSLVATARAADDEEERAELLRKALALWRGEPFADLPDEPFLLVERPSLFDRRLSAQEDLIDAELALGRHVEVLGEIEGLIREYAYDERLRGQQMLALYRAGRRADALDAFTRARRSLDELGLEPGPELRALQRDIFNDDPKLLPARAPTVEVDVEPRRKTVTVVFVSLAGPQEPGEELDPERFGLLGDRIVGETRSAAGRHGGTGERLPDGSAMAVFGIPEAHEDDALRAVRAASEIREALRDSGLDARVGISTGEVLVGGGGTVVAGIPVSGARQLEQAAPSGEILLGAQTLRLVRSAVTVEPLEVAETHGGRPVFRLLAVIPGAPAIKRHLEAPLVGREGELAELLAAFEEAGAERRCRIVTIFGEAGIGKTRLATELGDRVREEATVLIGRCVSYGEGASYLPLREIVEQAGDDLDSLLAGAGSIGEEHLILRGYFESLAADRPVLLVFEDVHWAEPTLLDLIESFADHTLEALILVLCLARPELLDERPSWSIDLKLEPLQDEHTVALLDQLQAGLESEHTARIAKLSEGNPLFAEQLLAYVGEGGSLESVPPTVEALLASRLDRLGPGERAVLQRAAVVGREFDRSTVAQLAAPEVAATIERHLAELVRVGLVRTSRQVSTFQHALIRDVAYASLTRAQRGELHERLADALERDRAASDELVGYHLEQAFRYAPDFGAVNGHARRLAVDAGRRLGAAGIRAWKRGDTPAALNLLGRATELLPERDPLRLELRCELGVALRGAGELNEAAHVLADAASTSVDAHDRRAELRARLELANVRLLAEGGGSGELLAAAEEGIPVFEAVGDDRSLSRAWRFRAYVEGAMSCRYAASVEAAEHALEYCKRSGWSTAACLGDLASALHYGPTPVEAGVRRCRQLLKGADIGGEANVLAHLGALEAMRERFDEARRLARRSQALYEDLAQRALGEATAGEILGTIELLDGDPAAAEQAFRRSCEALESAGDRAYLATRATQLADALYRIGRREEAGEWSRLAEGSAAPDDIPTQFQWRSVRARLLASEGRAEEAVALALEAERLAEQTDALDQRAQVVLAVAEVLRLVGRDADSTAAGERALTLFEQKGNTAAAAQVRSLLAS
jgi:DNA-binding SARP family transcriptional activator